MTTGTLNPSRFTSAAQLQAAVGTQYHLGLSCTLAGGASALYYGYLLSPDNSQSGGFHQRSDTASKEALINYSSGNLIDRDLAFFPRVTDGDFSGGGYQEVFLQLNRYFDSDLDPRVPGFLQLRHGWARSTQAALTLGSQYQVISFRSDLWFTFAEANGNIYSVNGATTTSPVASPVLSLDSDGTYLYAGTNSQLYRSSDGASWTTVTAALGGVGTALQWWVINQGTNGYYAYVQTGTNLLYRVDLTQSLPITVTTGMQVPVGSNAFNIIDVVEYQTSVAILTSDVRGQGIDVWYSDGLNLTRILRLDGYAAAGMCNSLGNLYVSLYSNTKITSPILAQISSGSFTVVARPGSPFAVANQTCGQPRSSSQFVYWPIFNPSINGISSAPGVVLQYDTQTGAVSHLQNFDTTDMTTVAGALRTIAAFGDDIAFVYSNGTSGICQYQLAVFGTLAYAPSGWLVSSHIDFDTPGIAKRFRRIEVHHAPLNAGEQILINAYVDQDPLVFTTALTPVPASATATNNVLASTVTSLTVGTDTVGKTLYFALQLTAGTSNLTTPRVSYVSIEIGGTWTWELLLACSSKRRLLDGNNEETQPTGHDLAYLLLLAYEQGQYLTLYHRNGQSYTVTIESADFWNPSPQVAGQPQETKDEEYFAHVVLRQAA